MLVVHGRVVRELAAAVRAVVGGRHAAELEEAAAAEVRLQSEHEPRVLVRLQPRLAPAPAAAAARAAHASAGAPIIRAAHRRRRRLLAPAALARTTRIGLGIGRRAEGLEGGREALEGRRCPGEAAAELIGAEEESRRE